MYLSSRWVSVLLLFQLPNLLKSLHFWLLPCHSAILTSSHLLSQQMAFMILFDFSIAVDTANGSVFEIPDASQCGLGSRFVWSFRHAVRWDCPGQMGIALMDSCQAYSQNVNFLRG